MKGQKRMADLFNWVEIPITDVERAVTFYQTILGVEKLEQQDMGGMIYIFLPMDGEGSGGALVKHENYRPANGDGVCVYVVVKGDLNATLTKVEAAGGKIVVPKMALGEMSPGYCAQFIDSESNRIGLWSAE
jgi:predicted enzyme related to lactoylglutathione lyase